MGMPITVEVTDSNVSEQDFADVFAYFTAIDERFSTYKASSEITKINKKEISELEMSTEMETIFKLCEETKVLTHGYFDIRNRHGEYDPSGLVKGWAIYHAAEILRQKGFENMYVEAGGDIQTYGTNNDNQPWSIGLRNPFNQTQIVKVLYANNLGVATSGTYVRGQHIYNPFLKHETISDIVSLTVIGPNIYEADRFATAAFAMGREGITFIENLPGFEGYMIDKQGTATMTNYFENYTKIYA